jgi:hypothetical protein
MSMALKNKFALVVSVFLVLVGNIGLIDRWSWLTNSTYRATLKALGPPNANSENLIVISISLLLVVLGLTLLAINVRKIILKRDS